MGLGTVVRNAVSSGFNALGSSSSDGLQTEIVYTKVVTGSYDSSTGKRSNTTSSTTLDVIYYKVRDKEVDGVKIKINDIRIIFPQSRLSFSPSADDYITFGGERYEIIQIIKDPANAVWLLFVRGV